MFRCNSDVTKYLTLDDLLSISIGELSSGPGRLNIGKINRLTRHKNLLDDGFPEPLASDFAFFGHRECDSEGKAFLPRVKTAQLLAKNRGQHRHRTLNKIHTSRLLASITVQCGIGLYEMRHIGDVYTDTVSPVIIAFHRESVIEILGSRGVDSENTVTTKIFTKLELSFGNSVMGYENVIAI